MPPTRTESAAEPAEALPAGAAAAAQTPAPTGGFKAWLPLVATLLIMPVLAYSMTTFVLLPRLQKGLGMAPVVAADTKNPKSTAPAKKDSVVLNKLLVNVAGTMGARYLLVSISVVGSDADFKTKMADFEPQLRDMACGALSAKTLTDLEKPGARNLIRTELISGFNNILGGSMVQEIYLTEFAIQ
jgi:flagellar FliL protein